MRAPGSQGNSRQLYLRLLSYVRPHARIFSIAILGMVATAATEPLFPALMKPLLDGGFSGATANRYFTPLAFALALVGIFVLRGAFFRGLVLLGVGFKPRCARFACEDVRAAGALSGQFLR